MQKLYPSADFLGGPIASMNLKCTKKIALVFVHIMLLHI